MKWVNLCVLRYEPNREQRLEIQQRFADAVPPPDPVTTAADEAMIKSFDKMGKELSRLARKDG